MLANDFYAMLNTFARTPRYYRHWSGMLVSDGVKFLVDVMNAYWLLDVIASWQPKALQDESLREFQLWELVVRSDKTARVSCLRDMDDVAFRQEIPYTEFPFEYLRVYVERGVMLLPSEH